MTLSRHSGVWEDLLDIHQHLAKNDPDAADRVIHAVEKAIHRITQNPHLGPLYPVRIAKLRGIRMIPVSEYRNYLVFYKALESETRILYVFHGARNIPKLIRTEIRD